MRRQGLLSVALLGVALSAAEQACTTLLTPVTRYGKEGEGPGEINTAFHAVGARGHVFVSDFWNHRIQVFTLDGEFHKTIGGKGTAPGRLMFPMGMAVLDDELYVTEGLNHRVQVFTLGGAPIRSFGEQGTGDGQVNYPPAIALSDEAAYVTDRANERVVVFERRTGAFARVIGADGATFAGVMGVAFDAGELFVTDPSCLAMLSRMDFDPKYRGHDAPLSHSPDVSAPATLLVIARCAPGGSCSTEVAVGGSLFCRPFPTLVESSPTSTAPTAGIGCENRPFFRMPRMGGGSPMVLNRRDGAAPPLARRSEVCSTIEKGDKQRSRRRCRQNSRSLRGLHFCN